MNSIEVVAAIIRDEQGRYFVTQRGYGDMKDGFKWSCVSEDFMGITYY